MNQVEPLVSKETATALLADYLRDSPMASYQVWTEAEQSPYWWSATRPVILRPRWRKFVWRVKRFLGWADWHNLPPIEGNLIETTTVQKDSFVVFCTYEPEKPFPEGLAFGTLFPLSVTEKTLMSTVLIDTHEPTSLPRLENFKPKDHKNE